MYLCSCNKCGGIFEDKNPQVNAMHYDENIMVEPLVFIQEDANDPASGYYACPICKTDGCLSDELDPIELDIVKSGATWKLTDSDTNQYGRRLGAYVYEFKEDGRDRAVIDLEKYSWKEICDCCEPYYETMGDLFRVYGEESAWIIAECIFEMNLIKS